MSIRHSAKLLRTVALFLAFSLCFVFCCALAGLWGKERTLLTSILADRDNDVNSRTVIRQKIILDAGHGGMDGGASVGTLLEKDLNLTVVKQLAPLLMAAGFEVILTREEDTMLGEGKQSDLRTRLELTEQYPDALFVSIHMNKFPQTNCHGLTVYYSPNHPDSKRLGETVQKAVKDYLQPENRRVMKQADSAIYLLHRAKLPAILIECGFLSNPEDAAMLQDTGERAKLCAVIAAAIVEYEAARHP